VNTEHDDLATELLISPEALAAIQAEALAAKQAAKKSKRKLSAAGRETGFVVIPAAWVKALDRSRGLHRDTRSMAWELLQLAGPSYDGRELFLPTWWASRVGVPYKGRKAAFAELAALGLIEVRWGGRGKPFAITLKTMR
jgi:hypothetical protein